MLIFISRYKYLQFQLYILCMQEHQYEVPPSLFPPKLRWWEDEDMELVSVTSSVTSSVTRPPELFGSGSTLAWHVERKWLVSSGVWRLWRGEEGLELESWSSLITQISVINGEPELVSCIVTDQKAGKGWEHNDKNIWTTMTKYFNY